MIPENPDNMVTACLVLDKYHEDDRIRLLPFGDELLKRAQDDSFYNKDDLRLQERAEWKIEARGNVDMDLE